MSYIHQKNLGQKLKTLILAIAAIYIMVASSLFLFQEKIIFRPIPLQQDHVYQFNHGFEELFLKTQDNAVLNAIHFKIKDPKGVILYFHGNAGNLQRWGLITEYFVDLGYDLFVVDYRTYGKSTGRLSEQGLYDDAQLCYDYLKNRYQESDITVFGRSLGSGIATYIASKNDPNQLILETPYYSLADVAAYRFPIFPVKKLIKYELPNYQFIKNVDCPTTMIHGTEDYVVPYKSGLKLFESAPTNRSTLVTIEGGGHNNLITFDNYKLAIEKLLK